VPKPYSGLGQYYCVNEMILSGTSPTQEETNGYWNFCEVIDENMSVQMLSEGFCFWLHEPKSFLLSILSVILT
jgi:hypothetical protein